MHEANPLQAAATETVADTAEAAPVVSLASIAGMNMDAIEEVRFVTIALGRYIWEGVEAILEPHEWEDKNGTDINGYRVTFKMKIAEVTALVEASDTPEEWIGKEHTERFNFVDEVGLGRIKAFLVDYQVPHGVNLQDWIDKFPTHQFIGDIRHQVDKQDKSVKYARLNVPKGAGVGAAKAT